MSITFSDVYLFIAPFIVLIAALFLAFFIAPKDEGIRSLEKNKKR